MSVELAEVAPGVTADGERAQVAIGEGPVTAQVSCTALAKGPFTAATVTTSLTCPPDWVVRLDDAGSREKSAGLLNEGTSNAVPHPRLPHAPPVTPP